MNINTITAEDLRRMPDKEGLILQGCGGDLTEWVDGINEMLTKAGILKDGCQFENVAAFQHGELTCLLYPFDDVKLDIGNLPCGVYRPMKSMAAHGCRTLCRII